MWRRFFERSTAPAAAPFTVESHHREETVRMITKGLEATGLRELEIVDVPRDLELVVSALLKLIGRRVLEEKPSRDGATIGGPFLNATQTAIHVATLRLAAETIEPGARELFRVVDFDERVDAGFPTRLVATHLALLAASNAPKKERERLARRSIQLFPGSAPSASTQERFDRGENVENFLGWEALGDVLFERGLLTDGRAALEEAAKRCPAWAADFAAHVKAHAPASTDPRLKFWLAR